MVNRVKANTVFAEYSFNVWGRRRNPADVNKVVVQ